MELRDYLSVRRAYGLVRREMDSSVRLGFSEYAMLCHLEGADGVMNASMLARYQGVLRPTISHRAMHLCDLSFISRKRLSEDRRSISCSLTDEGRNVIASVSSSMCSKMPSKTSMGRITRERMVRYVDVMGSVPATSSVLVLLRLYLVDAPQTIAALVAALGLLQPTVSMAVSSLERAGKVVRAKTDARSAAIALTPEGSLDAEAFAKRISGLGTGRRTRRA